MATEDVTADYLSWRLIDSICQILVQYAITKRHNTTEIRRIFLQAHIVIDRNPDNVSRLQNASDEYRANANIDFRR